MEELPALIFSHKPAIRVFCLDCLDDFLDYFAEAECEFELVYHVDVCIEIELGHYGSEQLKVMLMPALDLS